DLRFKLPPLEQAANRRVQKEHPTSLSRQAGKVETLPNTVPKPGKDGFPGLHSFISTCPRRIGTADSRRSIRRAQRCARRAGLLFFRISNDRNDDALRILEDSETAHFGNIPRWHHYLSAKLFCLLR